MTHTATRAVIRKRRVAVLPGSERLPWARGLTNRHVSHYSMIEIGRGSRLSHHTLRKPKPGAWTCGICGRWVVRGMGRWWENWNGASS